MSAGNRGVTSLNARSALDHGALQIVRGMKKCGRLCPAFNQCPLMPMAVQPKDDAKRICLVNCGEDRLKVAYYKMFVGGQEGVVQMLQTNLLEYGQLLNKSQNLTNKDRLRAMEKFNSMLGQLHKMMGQRGGGSPGTRKEDDDEMDEVVLIASRNDPKPDPESLEHSPMLQDLITHEDTPRAPKPQAKQPEVDLGKELLDKFFPEKD
jgi:hypothetical protein